MMNKFRMPRMQILLIMFMLIAVSCSSVQDGVKDTLGQPSSSPSSNPGDLKLKLIPAFGDIVFETPVGLVHAVDGSGRLFVLEKPGIISVLSDSSDHAKRSVFLDIRDIVFSKGSEQGLLGLAFHPDYAKNGYIYINYTTKNTTVIARYTADPSRRDAVDSGSGKVLLEFPQPFANHKGGQLAFDKDGYLLIAVGDGGSAGDPYGNGQNLKVLLGKILRIDVNHSSGGKAYAIPVDNPFAGNNKGYREEIYAYGLRNPWRFSIDPKTGWLWAADVGQDKVEEVDIIAKGGNYGWNVMEGSSCYKPATNCDKSGKILPIWEYTHQSGVGGAVIGGYMYRGRNIPELYGSYIAADFIDGRMWVIRYDGVKPAEATLQQLAQPGITSFGVNADGEIYVCLYDGHIMRLSK